MSIKNSLNLKLAILMVLLIPIFFGFRVEYLVPLFLYYTIWDILIIALGLVGLLFFGYFLIIRIFSKEDLEKMKSHEIVYALIVKNFRPLIINFLATMILEELIFRFYVIGVLDMILDWTVAIILSSIIFSLYHIHIWFSFKNSKILAVYLIYAFLLGILNGIIYFKLGLVFCILIHYGLVLILYSGIARKI
ncbi:MAG: CPBP family intramembrane metalloprotease [Promethearchaeota archaeon]|nr:MAG: CPBP family intramembrane metalloprotease [Candidatus Lokiarchaeota archaeon]